MAAWVDWEWAWKLVAVRGYSDGEEEDHGRKPQRNWGFGGTPTGDEDKSGGIITNSADPWNCRRWAAGFGE